MNDIEFTDSPSADDIDFVTQMINNETTEYGRAKPFAFWVRDDAGNIIAGANGFVIYGAVYTDQLWVHEAHRGQGYANALMAKVHDHGVSEGCRIATIQTMGFQDAAGFYKQLGYVEDFRRTGYVKQSDCIFMRKDL